MEPTAIVDLLRKTLIRQGHIVPTASQRDSACIILNQGEYLVSILSQDDQTMDFISSIDEAGEYSGFPCASGSRESGWSLYGTLGKDFDYFVDVLKFVWLIHGASAAVNFSRNVGLHGWSTHSSKARESYVDQLVTIAQQRLRQTGDRKSVV